MGIPAAGDRARTSVFEGRCQEGSGDVSVVSCQGNGETRGCASDRIFEPRSPVWQLKQRERRKNSVCLPGTPVIVLEMQGPNAQ